LDTGYAIAADAILVVHFLFILFVAAGGLLALRWRRLVYLHVPAVCWGVYVSLSGRFCPLTVVEQSLRSAAGQRGYAGGFIDHYLVAVIYPEGLTRPMQIGIGLVVISINAWVYGYMVYRRRAARYG